MDEVDEVEIKIDELSKWKETLELDLKELIKELEKVEEQFIRQKTRFEIFNGIESKQNQKQAKELYDYLGTLVIQKGSLEKETTEKQAEIWMLITHINMKLVALGVVL